jgi:hypothetical protein
MQEKNQVKKENDAVLSTAEAGEVKHYFGSALSYTQAEHL